MTIVKIISPINCFRFSGNPFNLLNQQGVMKCYVSGSGPALFIPICDNEDQYDMIRKVNKICGFSAISTFFIEECFDE